MAQDFDAVHTRREGAGAPVLVTDEMAADVAGTLTSAFAGDPVMNYFLREDGAREQVRAAMIGAQVTSYRKNGWAIAAPDASCAMLWSKPGHKATSMGLWQQLKMIPRLIQMCGGISRVPRVIEVMNGLEANHPKEPDHYYLFMIGVHQDHQGQGLGSTILAKALETVDAEGMPAYLENTNPRNMPLYERHGFKIMKEVTLGKGRGPSFWPMWREPQ